MPVITAKRRSPCARCSLPIEVGELIDFTRINGALHIACTDGIDDPEDAIRGAYERYTSDSTKGGLSYSDQRAFDLCVEEHGYVPTLRALYEASPRAKQAQDAYADMRLRRRGWRVPRAA